MATLEKLEELVYHGFKEIKADKNVFFAQNSDC
jgi:hypothetical protein